MEKLLSCEYPFRWQLRTELEIIPDNMIDRLTDQLNEKVFEDEICCEHLMLYVALAYEHGFENRFEEALKMLEKGENKLSEFNDNLSSQNMYDALRHIILSTKVYLLVQKEDLDGIASIISEIPSVNSMNIENEAALCGLRAVFCGEYGIDGTRVALRLSSKAIKLNPNEPLWYFMKGKYLGRIRRVERPYDIPHREEREHLQKSIEKSKTSKRNASFMVFTAQLYRETANRMFRSSKMNPSIDREIRELNQKSLEYYDESIKLKADCSHMMFRCAKGYISLPPPYRNERLEQAENLLKKGLEISPNSGYGNHVMAQYYERIKKQPQEAIEYLKRCEKKKIFGATMDLLRLEYRLDKKTDVAGRLCDLLKVYDEKQRKCQLYCQLMSYHVFVSNNLDEACSFAEKVIRINFGCEDMIQHRPICIFVREPFNLYEVLIDEVKIKMLNPKLKEEKRKYYDQFLMDLVCVGKEMLPAGPRYLKDSIINARFTHPSVSKPAFNKAPYKQGPQKYSKGPYHHHNVHEKRNRTGFEKKNNRILGQHQEDFRNQEKYYNPSSRTASSYNWRSRQQPENRKEEEINTFNPKNKGIKTPKTVENITSTKNDGDESDDTEFRMTIYEKSKRQEVNPQPSMNKPNDVVVALQKMKIRNDVSSEKSKTPKKEDPLSREIRRKDDSKESDKNLPVGRKHAKGIDAGLEYTSKHFHETKPPRDLDEGNNNDSNRRSDDHRKHESKYSRRRSYSPVESSTSKKESRSHRKQRARENSSYSEEDSGHDGVERKSIDSRRRDNRSRGHESKRSHRKRNSSYSEDGDDGWERKLVRSGRRDYYEHKLKHSYRRRNLSKSEDDDGDFECKSVGSKQKSKYPHGRRNSNKSGDDDNCEESKLVDSERRDSRSHDPKSKKSYKKMNSSESMDENDSVERTSISSKRRYSRSHDHESKQAYRKRNSSGSENDDEGEESKSVDSRRRDGRSHDHKSRKYERKRNSSKSGDDNDSVERKSISSRQSKYRPDHYVYKSKHARREKNSRNSKYYDDDDDDDDDDRRSERWRSGSQSHGLKNHRSKYSRREEYSNNSEGDDGPQSDSVSQSANQSHDNKKYKSKHSRNKSDNFEDNESDCRSNFSRQSERSYNHTRSKSESKYSHRKRSSDSESDDLKHRSDFLEESKSRRESKYSPRRRYSSYSENEKEPERGSLRQDDRYESLSSRHKRDGEGLSSKSHRNDYYSKHQHRNRDKDRDSHSRKKSEIEYNDRSEDKMSDVLIKVSKKFEPKKIFQ